MVCICVYICVSGCNSAPVKNEVAQMIKKEWLVRFVPANEPYCTEKTIFLFAKNRLDAINKTLEVEPVKKFILVKL